MFQFDTVTVGKHGKVPFRMVIDENNEMKVSIGALTNNPKSPLDKFRRKSNRQTMSLAKFLI
jgi:hypothetical protein